MIRLVVGVTKEGVANTLLIMALRRSSPVDVVCCSTFDKNVQVLLIFVPVNYNVEKIANFVHHFRLIFNYTVLKYTYYLQLDYTNKLLINGPIDFQFRAFVFMFT